MIRIKYIRTSMLLLDWDGKTVLTDPWFAGHMRGLPVFVRPDVQAHELPAIDIVLVSHFHPDHFDARALSRLAVPCGILIGPPGIEERAKKLPCRSIVTLNDGERLARDGWTVHASRVPHSGYENAYVLKRGAMSMLFAGDARYGPVFRSIGSDHAPVVSLLPVGGTIALGRRIVMNPTDALQAAIDLRTRCVVPIHPGGEWMSVPPLSLHPGRASHLAELAREANAPFAVAALAPGESVTIGEGGEIV